MSLQWFLMHTLMENQLVTMQSFTRSVLMTKLYLHEIFFLCSIMILHFVGFQLQHRFIVSALEHSRYFNYTQWLKKMKIPHQHFFFPKTFLFTKSARIFRSRFRNFFDKKTEREKFLIMFFTLFIENSALQPRRNFSLRKWCWKQVEIFDFKHTYLHLVLFRTPWLVDIFAFAGFQPKPRREISFS